MLKRLLFAVLGLGALLIGGEFARAAPAAPAAQTHPAVAPAWGTDIQVNPLATATPDVNRNISLAINPANPDQVVAGYESYSSASINSSYAWSTDAGRTWANGGFYSPWISDTVPFGNTSVAFDRQGIAYYLSGTSDGTVTGYAVVTGTVGAGWGTPVPVALSPFSVYHSQAHITVDNGVASPFDGSVYIIWRYYDAGDQGVWLRYSRDGGRTWTADIPVSDAGHEAAEQPQVVPARDGTLYAAFGAEDTNLFLDRSTDGGATWATDHLITGAEITPIGALDAEGHELLLQGTADGGAGVVITNDPQIAVDPSDPNTVYAVWNDGRWDTPFTIFGHTGQHADVAFSRSTDGGATWSAPARINDDALANGVDQWAPNIATGPDGRIGVTWYDRRDDPAHLLYRTYYSESTDGGVTWSTNQPVADVLSDPVAVYNGDGNGEVGDYVGFTFGPDYALASWVDSRGGRVQDFYVDHGAIPAAPPTATATIPPAPTDTPVPPAPTDTPLATATPLPTETPCALSFSDVHPSDYFYGPVSYLACHGVIAGYADGTFRPYNATTRGQLSKLIVLGFGWAIQTPATPTFSDVPAGHPFYAFVETIVAHGVVSGYADGTFRPYASVTRGQLAKIVVNAKGWTPLTPPTPTFADVPAADPFFGYVERAAAESVLSGYDCGAPGEPCPGRYFRPGAGSTRGQISKILYNVLQAP